MAALSRYFHTLRHLRGRQVWFQLKRRLPRPRPNLSAAPSWRAGRELGWTLPARREPSLSDAGTMTFVGASGKLDELGWSGPGAELLWRYNQHYFDDLSAFGAATRSDSHRTLIARWLAGNLPASRPGWDPYPTSLRLVNWCKWLMSGAEPMPGQVASMAVQARFLSGNLEYHVLGNHLLANAKALVFVGSMFEGQEADKWLRTGLRILARELSEQILSDGGNFERSPMYHALCLEDMLDLVNLATARPARIDPSSVESWRQTASNMRFWLAAMCHPDGEIAHFNDAAIGIAPSPAELARYAEELNVSVAPAKGVEQVGDGVIWLRESGYVRAETDDAVLFCDVAPLGPDYLPAHGHADTLSFELSVKGRRVIVNGGTSRYGSGAERIAERGTAAHSTVMIDGCNSSEVWGGFRVARRARPFDISIEVDKGIAMIAASHDGYKRLPRSPVHSRAWRISGRSLEVVDRVTPACPAMGRFIAHPDIAFENAGEGSLQLGPVHLEVETGALRRAPAFHSARFAGKRSTEAACITLEDGRSRVKLAW
ncbi:MAG: alginate lyase family protein [Sphingosinicella sp.]|nr:alginate lyase family protein [Sphingosinicella sp.]